MPGHSIDIIKVSAKFCQSEPFSTLRCHYNWQRQINKLILSWFGSSIPSIICRSLLSLQTWHIFLCQSWLYILTACIRVFSSFSFFANSLMSSMYIRSLIFSCDLLSLYPAVHFLCIWLSGIMAIRNSNGDSASPWKIPLWIFASAKRLPPTVNSTLQVFMVFSIKFMTSSDILYILKQFIIQLCGTISYAIL